MKELIANLRAGTVTPQMLDDAANKLEWLAVAFVANTTRKPVMDQHLNINGDFGGMAIDDVWIE